MKKLLTLVLSLAMIGGVMAGCGNNNTAPNPDPNPEIITDPEGGEFAGGLPTYNEGIITMPSETKENPELAKLIVDTYEIPEEEQATTQYYYNYVDLNGDGTDEIFAVAMGTYTSGTGGDSGLIVNQKDGKLELMQTFTLIQEPVVISDNVTNGYKDIAVTYYNGSTGESLYKVLTFGKDSYPNVDDGTSVETLEGITGTAIFYNDPMADQDTGAALYLAK